MNAHFWMAYVVYVIYLLVFLAMARLIAWILARAFRVREKLELLEKQNELLKEIKDSLRDINTPAGKANTL